MKQPLKVSLQISFRFLQFRKLLLFVLCFSSTASFMVLPIIFPVKGAENLYTVISCGGWQQQSFQAENDIFFQK